MFVRVDGRPTPAAVTAAGVATFSVVPPARYDGRENVVVDATLGDVAATQNLHITGGPPVRLTLQVAAARVVADGKHGTELRVQAVDSNGTPTSVSGLCWETPAGRIRAVRVPRDGEYLAEYVPERTREPRRETVAVMASETLRADATLELTPPPVRLVAGARTGLFTNFGETVGPAAFVEGLAPVHRGPLLHLLAGFSAGYLRGDVTGSRRQPKRHGAARDQPVSAARRRARRARAPPLSRGGGRGRGRVVVGLGPRHRQPVRARPSSTRRS